MYADDSSLYCTGNDTSEVRSNLQLGLNVASEWFHNNRLLINNRLLKVQNLILIFKVPDNMVMKLILIFIYLTMY